MPLEIIQYPHPTLRHISKPLKKVDAELRHMIAEMFDLMYEANGIGLAANQVDLPYRLFVLNLSGDEELKDQEQVFINPVILKRNGSVEHEEGCLSLPKLYADVRRAETVTVSAYDLAGREVTAEATDLFSRAVQHETDHLDGVLFVDRLSEGAKLEVKEKMRFFEDRFFAAREAGDIPSDEAILARLRELERVRT